MVYTQVIKYLFKNHLFYDTLGNFMFAHHPDCNPYSSHVWTFKRWKFCKSCSTGFIMLNILFYEGCKSTKFASFCRLIFQKLIQLPIKDY